MIILTGRYVFNCWWKKFLEGTSDQTWHKTFYNVSTYFQQWFIGLIFILIFVFMLRDM